MENLIETINFDVSEMITEDSVILQRRLITKILQAATKIAVVSRRGAGNYVELPNLDMIGVHAKHDTGDTPVLCGMPVYVNPELKDEVIVKRKEENYDDITVKINIIK